MSRGFGCVCEVDRGVVGALEVRKRVHEVKTRQRQRQSCHKYVWRSVGLT